MCHTDVKVRSTHLPAVLPIIPGHEGAGIVEAVGAAVADVRVGDHVVVSYSFCGDCKRCKARRPTFCKDFRARNLQGHFGDVPGALDEQGQPLSARWFGQSSFAGHVVTAARSAVVVDKTLPLPMLGPLACGFMTGAGAVFNTLGVSAGDVVAVYGTGAVGLAAIMAAKVVGAERIIAVDLHESRLKIALELGATHIVKGGSAELLSKIRQAAGPDGADHSLDTTCVPSVMNVALQATRAGGIVGFVGSWDGDWVVDPVGMMGNTWNSQTMLFAGRIGRSPGSYAALAQHILNDKTLKMVAMGDSEARLSIPRLIDLWQQGRFPFEGLIQTYPLSKINEAEEDAATGRVVKPVLIPGDGTLGGA
eukprot:TRINITY_DN8327_c0_g1_i1.p1 TRINITY_DN8327_c0_g1~~TRINITY_DN8327_c0_g1_i1.p1  ORF type:complete len:425 (-),score=56.25 TRINITY_DN8327_c0_g1_i1:548-1639(-)